MEYENEEDEFLENAEREAKRKYLREEILEKNYSAQEFTSFIEKNRGADVDLWPFEELQECVKQFQVMVTQREKPQSPKLRGRSPSPKPEAQETAPVPLRLQPSPEVAEQRPALVVVQESPLDLGAETRRKHPAIQQVETRNGNREVRPTGSLSENSSPLRLFPHEDHQMPPPLVNPILPSDPAPFLSSPAYCIPGHQLCDTPLSTSPTPISVQIEK